MAGTYVSLMRTRAFALMDVLVVLVLGVGVMTLVLPAIVQAEDEDSLTTCLNRAKGLNDALLAYANDHAYTIPGDGRDQSATDWWASDDLRHFPESEVAYAQSWLGKVESYLPADPTVLDCPIVDDHRKSEWWPTDYAMNRWGINMSPDSADEPAKAMLVGEPNQQLGTIAILGEMIAWYAWGPRPDLEQNQVGSLSFGFADGHAVRIAIAEGDNPHLAEYPQIYMANPGDEDHNRTWLWWTARQAIPAGF